MGTHTTLTVASIAYVCVLRVFLRLEQMVAEKEKRLFEGVFR
jgi:hypothetical protein